MIDDDALSSWLDRAGIPGAGARLESWPISGGSQNEIYGIRRGGFECALRISPGAAPAARDDGLVREWRVVEALSTTDVPHARGLAMCDDRGVLGRPFYLMELVDGWSPIGLDNWPAPFDSDLSLRPGLAFELVDGLARLARVDWRARGLHDFGRPDGFHDRQVERWTSFLDRFKVRELPGFHDATAWLRVHRPLDFVPGLMHGDYQFANVMYRHGAPARLAAIVDWEMTTIGDPKLDLAWVLMTWPDGATGAGETTAAYVDMEGMPPRDEIVERYARETGRQVDDLDYYLVLARWKLAIVLEQGYQRAGADDEKLQKFGPIVLEHMRSAADLAATTDYR